MVPVRVVIVPGIGVDNVHDCSFYGWLQRHAGCACNEFQCKSAG